MMLMPMLALLLTLLPEGAQNMPFTLSVTVEDGGEGEAVTTSSIMVQPGTVHRIPLRCDTERSFCARILDVHVIDAGIARSVDMHLREWDGARWATLATPSMMFAKDGAAHGSIDTAEARITVGLGSPALPEPHTI